MSKITVSESMIGLKVTTLQGNKEKIIDVAASGYKLNNRRSMVKARQLVKKGKAFIEIEKPSAKAIRDTGMGYAEIIDPDLYLEAMGKKMPKAMIKALEEEGGSSSKSKKSKTKSKKSKTDKKTKSKKSTKTKESKKTKSKKPAKLDDLELLGDYGKRVPEGLRSVVASAIKDHLANFNLPGPVRVITNMDVFDFIGDDGAVGSMKVGIHFDMPEVSKTVITEKTMKKVKSGLWEKNAKIRNLCFKKFGADFQIHDMFVDEDGEEYIFAGVNIAKKKPVLVFHRPEDEKCICAPIDTAVSRLELAPDSPESEEELDLSDFDSSEEELVDADEIDSADVDDRTMLIDEEAVAEMETEEEIETYLLDNFDVAVMIDYFNSTFDNVSRREARIIKSKDEKAIAALLASLMLETEGSDDSGDSNEVDSDEFDNSDFDDDFEIGPDSESGEDEAEDFEDEALEDFSGEEAEEDEAEEDEAEEIEAEDVDTMLEALIEADIIDAKKARRISDADILALFAEHLAEAEEAEAEEELDIDDVIDYLIENETINAKQARKLSDEELIALYNSNNESDISGSEEEFELTESDEEDSEKSGDSDFSDFSSDD